MNPDCEFEYETPEPVAENCPKCGHIYGMWVNYREWREDMDKQKFLVGLLRNLKH